MSASRAKGTRFETAVVKWLREALQDDRIERRSLNGRNDRGDVAGVRAWGQRVVIECKSQARHSLAEWLAVVWLTPAMDRLFTGPASDRRPALTRGSC